MRTSDESGSEHAHTAIKNTGVHQNLSVLISRYFIFEYFYFKILNYLVFYPLLLILDSLDIKGFQLFEMRPALLVERVELVITLHLEQGTGSNIHQISFFFFRPFFLRLPQFPNANEQQYIVEVRQFLLIHEIF